AAGSPDIRRRDIRKQEVRRPGSRNRCPVGMEGYSQLLRISRLPLRWPLRARLPAPHPPLLQWQHQKPLPIRPHQGRVEQDHTGWCRPRDSRPTRQSNRAQFGSLSLFLEPSTGPNRQRIQRTLSLDESSASALRAASLREAGFAPEGLAAGGLENSLA